MVYIRQALLLGTAYMRVAACLAIEQPSAHASAPSLTFTKTTTIAWTGSTTSSITFTPCSGPVTVIVETPLVMATCPSTTSSQPKATSASTSSPTSIISTVPVSSMHPPDTSVTTTVPGTTPGTTTITLSLDSTTPCATSVVDTTIPPTPTFIPGGPCPIKQQCAPAGLAIDYYANEFGGYGRGVIPSSYYLETGLVPFRSGLTNVTFFAQDHGPNTPNLPIVYPDSAMPGVPYYVGWSRETNGGIVVDGNNFTLVYSGFYRAPATGTYRLCASADNEHDLFFGQGNAFSCANGKSSVDAQPLLKATGGFFVNEVKCATVDLVRGQFYPVRNVMGNWQGPSAFDFTIQEPGADWESRKNAFAGEMYPRDCGLFF